MRTTDFGFVSDRFPARKKDSNKGDYGKALLVAGSYGMSGAAVLATLGCLRSGIGLLRVALPEIIYPIVASAAPEAVFLPLETAANGSISAASDERIAEFARASSAVLAGCGMGNNADTKAVLLALLNIEGLRLIIDADGINSVCGNINVLRNSRAHIVLTPHPGEMSRLTGLSVSEIQKNRVAVASSFSEKTGCVIVLKGTDTVIASPGGEIYINPTGNPGMARGGCGDVLAGMLLSFAAQGLGVFDAAVCAAYVHGAAGDAAAARLSQQSMLPSDLIGEIPGVFLNIETRRD